MGPDLAGPLAPSNEFSIECWPAFFDKGACEAAAMALTQAVLGDREDSAENPGEISRIRDFKPGPAGKDCVWGG